MRPGYWPGRLLSVATTISLAALVGCMALAGPPAEPPLVNITDAQRGAAMVSIHVHARYYPHSPDTVALVIPLQQASQILHQDAGMGADSRRRRAAAKLAAYWIHRFDFGDFDEEIEQIAGPDAVHTIGGYLGDVIASDSLPPAEITELKLLNLLKFMTLHCPWLVNKDLRGGVRTPPPIEWNFEILVPRSVPDIARALDPQSWNECSVMFRASHLVKTPSCCPKTDTADCSCQINPDGTPKPIDPPKPRGMPYDFNALYEHSCYDAQDQCATCDYAGVSCDLNYKNLLCVRTRYDTAIGSSDLLGAVGRYDVDYHLGRSLAGELSDGEGYLLDSDQGNLHVRAPAAEDLTGVAMGVWSVVHSDKHMSFKDTGMNTEIGELLKAIEDELKGELAEHACCYVKPEKWGTNLTQALKALEKRLGIRLPPYKVPLPPIPPEPETPPIR